MTGILAAVCIAILVVMALSLARAFNAPTVYDRKPFYLLQQLDF